MAKYVERDNPIKKIARYLLPWKGDSRTEMIRKVIFLASAVVLIVSVTMLIVNAVSSAQDARLNDELSDLYHGTADKADVSSTVNDGNTSGSALVEIDTSKPDDGTEPAPEKEREVLEEFKPLLEINEDVVGWITMGDDGYSFVDKPVVQGDDNDYYLHRNIYGQESKWGTVFAEYRVPLTAKSEPANLILYGHNDGGGEYFGMVPRYFNYKPGADGSIDFYRKYPTITFSTLYEKYTYKIFGGMLVNINEEDGDVFYYLRRREFDSKAQFDEYIASILDRTTFYTPVDLKYGDHLLTLSTCIVDYGIEARWVLFARRVREGEDPTVDVSKAYPNPDPLYFDYYYKLMGGSWGGRKWPAEMIAGYSY